MVLIALAFALAVQQQEPAVVDAPVYENPAFGISLPRPFDDWVFSPATDNGTTTVIFQPRSGTLSAQLWGALVLTWWDGPVPINDIADSRIASTWRRTLGPSFALRARDSLTVDGLPAIHVVMSGAIGATRLDVEEYLVARDSELVLLQFRYPLDQPHDSIAAGYLRAVAGLRLGAAAHAYAVDAPIDRPEPPPPERPFSPPPPAASPWDVAIDGQQVVFDLPEELRAIAPGRLTSEATSSGRRHMRWSADVGAADTALYAVGRFHLENRRAGRLTLHLWRNDADDPALTHAADTLIAAAADAWAVFWKDFGPVPTTELTLVETAWPHTHGAAGILFLGADAGAPTTIARELSRTWWGGLVRDDSAAGRLIDEALPAWSATLIDPVRVRLIPQREIPQAARAVMASRSLAGDARFRVALRTFIADSRRRAPALNELFELLGDSAAAPLRAWAR